MDPSKVVYEALYIFLTIDLILISSLSSRRAIRYTHLHGDSVPNFELMPIIYEHDIPSPLRLTCVFEELHWSLY